MNIWIALLCALVGYLLGSIPFALVVMKVAAPGEELTGMEVDIGAEEPVRVEMVGGTAISVKLGAKYGMITALLDILKAAVPALVLKMLYPGMPYYLFAATTAVVGHNWPLYNRFKGGRGQSPMIGGFLVADWLGTLVTSFGAMILGLVILRNGVVGFLLGPWLMIPWLWFRTRDPWHLAYAVAVNLVIVVAMVPEFRSRRERARQGIAIDPHSPGGCRTHVPHDAKDGRADRPVQGPPVAVQEMEATTAADSDRDQSGRSTEAVVVLVVKAWCRSHQPCWYVCGRSFLSHLAFIRLGQ